MAPRILAVFWALGSVVASVAAETGSRQSLTARRATTAQQQAASEPCAIFDALTSPDQDCDYLVSYWGISLEDFIFWNPQVGDNCENISVGEGYCVKSTRTKPPSPPSKFNPDNGIETPSPTQPGMVGNCNKFHLVEDAATCEEIAAYNKISLEELFAWNTGLDKDCTNLWRGTHACVGVVGEGTPLPVQPGMVDDCDEFHLVRETTTCQGMADYHDISLAEVLEWNTGLDSTCSNLWLGTYACVGVRGEAKAEAIEGMPSAFPDTTKLDLSQPTPLPAGITAAAAASSVSVLPLTPMMVEVPEGTPEPFI